MKPILVTGGTGTLGRAVVRQLLDDGREVRVLSRRPRPEHAPAGVDWVTGDLLDGTGLDRALAGEAVVVHCASNPRAPREDIDGTARLLEAARRAGTPHLVNVSIVGADRVANRYYRAKVGVEELIEESGLPFSNLRATQFHEFVHDMARKLGGGPLAVVPAGMPVQPVAVGEVAARLAGLAVGEPAGRVADLGGPQVRPFAELVRACLETDGHRRPMLRLRLPGKAGRAMREGCLLTTEPGAGRGTFAEYLAALPG